MRSNYIAKNKGYQASLWPWKWHSVRMTMRNEYHWKKWAACAEPQTNLLTFLHSNVCRSQSCTSPSIIRLRHTVNKTLLRHRDLMRPLNVMNWHSSFSSSVRITALLTAQMSVCTSVDPSVIQSRTCTSADTSWKAGSMQRYYCVITSPWAVFL